MSLGIERHRNDVVAAETRPGALICNCDFIGHVFAREVGKRMRGGDLHLHVDGLGAHVERAAEYVWEAEDVVDLVGIVRAPRGDNHVVPRFLRLLGCDFGVGVGHGEYDRIGRHCPDHVWRERSFG